MPRVTYQNTAVDIADTESVLDGLENAGFAIPFSCRSGLCQSCMMQADSPPPASAQDGLSNNQISQHFFLACSCYPQTDMEVNLIGDTNRTQGIVVDKYLLNEQVMCLQIEADCRWFPGQYINLWHDDIQGRSYSIASRCDDKKIMELHIKRHEQGLVSRWVHDQLQPGQAVTLSKPMGNCFYSDEHEDKPLLMAATGTGLAPLYGILLEALARKHNAPIKLYAAAGEPSGLYYVDELKKLAATHTNIEYIPCVRRNAGDSGYIEEDVVPLVKERHQSLKGWKIFLCGSIDMIKQLQRHSFFQGAAVTDILVDAFTSARPS